MYLRIYAILCCAVLTGFAAAVQTNHRPDKHNSDIGFNDDAGIEGSGNDGEVTHDLEASGSGYGPDDEDTPIDTHTVKTVESKPVNGELPTNTRKLDIPDVGNPPPHETNIDNNNNNQINTPIQGGTQVKSMDTRTPFFAQPGILAAVIGGAVVGLLCAILVVMFIVYRMRKKDEGSYSLGEPKPSPNANTYNRGNEKEFYA